MDGNQGQEEWAAEPPHGFMPSDELRTALWAYIHGGELQDTGHADRLAAERERREREEQRQEADSLAADGAALDGEAASRQGEHGHEMAQEEGERAADVGLEEGGEGERDNEEDKREADEQDEQGAGVREVVEGDQRQTAEEGEHEKVVPGDDRAAFDGAAGRRGEDNDREADNTNEAELETDTQGGDRAQEDQQQNTDEQHVEDQQGESKEGETGSKGGGGQASPGDENQIESTDQHLEQHVTGSLGGQQPAPTTRVAPAVISHQYYAHPIPRAGPHLTMIPLQHVVGFPPPPYVVGGRPVFPLVHKKPFHHYRLAVGQTGTIPTYAGVTQPAIPRRKSTKKSCGCSLW
ncbi:unnamed protein product [Vitrella brassicaformis CCMP3155]|uniref:Uncharacterized protein n=1 Tax=Vitrella brassicaformis (strain CCMP3155) TaxID=1169540 RepID=A0A0G4GGF3_VITBC|nr:unnamed protein product [Vitrella brassicaformis CCMP3155]|eukprot:CEM28702.1 unnamed protein product [Vitrella brassicaformis CCMP3155]